MSFFQYFLRPEFNILEKFATSLGIDLEERTNTEQADLLLNQK